LQAALKKRVDKHLDYVRQWPDGQKKIVQNESGGKPIDASDFLLLE